MATRRLDFLYGCLESLDGQLEQHDGGLRVEVGEPASVLGAMLDQMDIGAVYVNREYTPFGRRRDLALSKVCEQRGVKFIALDDAVLNAPGAVLKADGLPYTVFTPYFRRASQHPILPVAALAPGAFVAPSGPQLADQVLLKPTLKPMQNQRRLTPGVEGANVGLSRIVRLHDYDTLRDVPASAQTSQMSVHMRFGTCSPRQFAAAVSQGLAPDHPLNRQLYWRDFYTQICWYFPHVFGHAFRRQYDAIRWVSDPQAFAQWQAGETGFPIVDAGMRELAQTGLMHNRVRMIVASFLTKNLHIDWRQGEAHFANHLIDYDPAVNNGNWQWGASTGCDAQPYFRVFNPWRQQKRFDKDCLYIKQWVPELAPYPASAIHKLETQGDFYRPKIADLRSSSEHIKAEFKSVSLRSS